VEERDFQHRYHEYQTMDQAEAQRTADAITLTDGRHPVVVGLPFGATIRYCLMLPDAAQFIRDLHPDRGLD